jgi:GrpB-like predicted nucleotidyltransferase (UPF0157 family)
MQRSTSSLRSIVVCDYDEQRPVVFEQIARPIQDAVGELDADVEHVGGTAVGRLRAKPVIDIDVVVASPAHVSITIDRLSALGYRREGGLGIPGREALMAPPGAPAQHLYVVVRGSQPHRDHVDFRDHLRAHPNVAQDYADLKDRLAVRHRTDRFAYTAAKAAFISRVPREARSPR